MFNELDIDTGEKDELDPVLDDDENFQDFDNDKDEDDDVDFELDDDEEKDEDDEDFEDAESGQTDSDDAESEITDGKDEEGKNTEKDDTANNTETAKGETHSDDTDTSATKKPLTKEENAVNALRRRQEALEAKLREEHTKTVIDVLNGTNPFTGKEMTDAHDVEVYERMRRIQKDGGDPIADYASTLAEERRQAERAKREEQEKATDFNTWAQRDAAAFSKANPDINVSNLFKDDTFRTIAEPLLQQRVPMSSIYSIYQKTQANIETVHQKAKTKMKEAVAGEIANERASAGSLKTNGEQETSLYTREQLAHLTEAEIEANWDKVERSYDALGKKK